MLKDAVRAESEKRDYEQKLFEQEKNYEGKRAQPAEGRVREEEMAFGTTRSAR